MPTGHCPRFYYQEYSGWKNRRQVPHHRGVVGIWMTGQLDYFIQRLANEQRQAGTGLWPNKSNAARVMLVTEIFIRTTCGGFVRSAETARIPKKRPEATAKYLYRQICPVSLSASISRRKRRASSSTLSLKARPLRFGG